MLDDPSNPISNNIVSPVDKTDHAPIDRWGLQTALLLIISGLIVGLFGLALVSNKFGNTDTYGLPVVGLGATALATGISRLFLKLHYAILVGIVAAPVSMVMLFVFHWVGVFLVAGSNS